MDKQKALELKKIATRIRKHIIEQVFSAKSGHQVVHYHVPIY